ncbi:MAG: serine/threonine-protein kinase [Chromatiaceae bacterium]
MDQGSASKLQIPGYQLKAAIGHGGMSTVYLAEQESLGREVALKVMSTTLVADAEFQQRFLNEGRIVARLRHPNIVVVYDVGFQAQCYYLAMSYLSGGTLKERVNAGLGLAEKLAIIRAIGDALGYAHDRGIVHRDVKPQNILFDEDNSPVLTDFGIAKSIVGDTKLTTTGTTFGSIPYMSPEQAKSAAVDHRSDLYSFGVVFWELLTGELPYTAETQFALAFKHATQPVPDLPPTLAKFQPVLNRLLAKSPGDRFASIHEMQNALDAVFPVADARVSAYPHSSDQTVLDLKPRSRGGPWQNETFVQTEAVPEHKVRLPIVVSVGVALAVLATAAYFVLRPIGPTFLAGPRGTQVEPTSDTSVQQAETDTAADTDVTATRNEQERPDGAGRLARLEAQAAGQWRAGKYLTPSGDNAFETYRSILRLEPGNLEARDKLLEIGRMQLGRQALADAERLLRDGKLQGALQRTEMGLTFAPQDAGLLSMRDRLRKEQAKAEH